MGFFEKLFGEPQQREIISVAPNQARKSRADSQIRNTNNDRSASGKSKAAKEQWTKEELLEEAVRVLQRSNAKVTRSFFEQHSAIPFSNYEERFGGWHQTLKAVRPLLGPRKDKELLEQIEDYLATQHSKPSDPVKASSTPKRAATAQHDNSPVSIFGDFLNFRGIQHAPVNEQGVVFLFGMICRELGYVVEIVRQGFPDCEAKRQVKSHGDTKKWIRVRIEFEFQSKNFVAHGHGVDGCDMIICWEHNWPDCPLEVMELKKVIASLPKDI